MKLFKILLAFLGIITAMILQSSVYVYAAGELQIKSESGKPFIFQPKAGEIINSKVFVRNLSKTEIAKVQIYPKDAVTTSDGRFDLLREDQKSKHVGTWLQISKANHSIEPGKVIEVPFTLKIPKKIEPGQYIGGIVVQGDPIMGKKSKEGVTFNLVPRAGIFVTVNAPGKQIKLLNINSFSGKVNFAGNEVMFTMALNNKGNMTLAPKAYIDLKDIHDKSIKKMNVDIGYIIPGEEIKREIKFSDISHFGAVKAELVMNYDEGKTAKASTHLFLIQKKVIMLVTSLLIFIFVTGVLVAKKFDFKVSRKEKVVSH